VTPLAFIASAAFRSERTIAKRFRNADVELARLLRDHEIEYHDDACTAVHVTAIGRARLKAERDAKELRHAS
jgi:hypothetical protein